MYVLPACAFVIPWDAPRGADKLAVPHCRTTVAKFTPPASEYETTTASPTTWGAVTIWLKTPNDIQPLASEALLVMKLLKAPPHELAALHKFTCMPMCGSMTVPIVEMSIVALPTASGGQDAVGGACVGTGVGGGKHAALDSKTKITSAISLTVTPFGAARGTTPHCRYTVHVTAVEESQLSLVYIALYVRRIPFPTCCGPDARVGVGLPLLANREHIW
jgi:hypothetical protein